MTEELNTHGYLMKAGRHQGSLLGKKKKVVADFNTDIKSHRDTISALATQISQGYEYEDGQGDMLGGEAGMP